MYHSSQYHGKNTELKEQFSAVINWVHSSVTCIHSPVQICRVIMQLSLGLIHSLIVPLLFLPSLAPTAPWVFFSRNKQPRWLLHGLQRKRLCQTVPFVDLQTGKSTQPDFLAKAKVISIPSLKGNQILGDFSWLKSPPRCLVWPRENSTLRKRTFL